MGIVMARRTGGKFYRSFHQQGAVGGSDADFEYLTYQLAVVAGIQMAPSRLEKVYGPYSTFFTKRFDREGKDRIHFASAMTMTNRSEEGNKEDAPSYLELAEFIHNTSCAIREDLHQLWRRIVFNMTVSNTDDHLRNHGFIMTVGGWRLAPAYDLNPSIEKSGLSLNVDLESNALDYDLAFSVGEYFDLTHTEMSKIVRDVKKATQQWESLAETLKIPRQERTLMSPAFLTN
ncbi:HipA-like protein [Chitinophaga polysaccharea]|uniref:HipA-like protein n=1 Tax=Chitinophaga polysaccharea TaxID=1293035 RepID=A0A561PG40_9BACT|nr:HipA domain-containing protein [Chitinophaga polysaccharea]TWF37075.1 HipA-like protein [Chitinophaga polysaccharea]